MPRLTSTASTVGAVLLSFVAPAFAEKLTPAWVELGPHGPVARVIMQQGAPCPAVVLDGQAAPMRVRPADVHSSDYPVVVCETASPLPATVKSAAVDFGGGQTQALALPVANPERIVVIGDTGCRIKDAAKVSAIKKTRDADLPEGKAKVQECDAPDKWPFPAIADQAASERPQLIIHVGDYLYRESACPDPKKCDHSVHGYNWATWAADFFTPASKLLPVAPWVFVRGNHEDCDRAWQGFFYFLDPRPASELSCRTPYTDPYIVNPGDLALAVLDSSHAADASAPSAEVKEYTKQLKAVQAGLGSKAGWLLTHRPVWAAKAHKGELTTLNATLEAAWKGANPSALTLLIAGHTHLFELLAFKQGLPMQVVIGDSGTDLAKEVNAKALHHFEIDGRTVAAGETLDHFCYGLLTPHDDAWRLRMRSRKGNDEIDCEVNLSKNDVDCTKK